MTANTWYCIAKTSTFDTGCSINVAFDGYDIQFSVSVKYGISAINITRCTIPDGIVFSIRLREGGSEWFVDLNSNTNISPIVTIADTEYWSNVNKPAREGNIILQLYDITSKYNTSTGGDSLFEIVNVGSVDTPRYAVVPKLYEGQNPGVISRTFMSFGGLGADTGDEGDGVAYLRNLLDVELANILEDEDVLTYDKHLDLWVNKRGGLNEEKLKEFLDKHKYITEDYVKDLMKLLGWFEFDEANHAVRVKSDFNFIVPNALSFGGIGQNDGPNPGGLSQVTIQLGENPKDSYVSENGIVILPAYPVVPTKVSAFENDKGYVVSSALDEYAKLTDIPVMEDFALAEDLNKLSNQVQGYENKFIEIGGSITDLETDISKLASIEDLEKLEEAVNPLFGYFDANGNANNALKLDGHSADYFATVDALNTHIKAFNTYKTTTDERLGNLEALWYMDDEGNVHTTHNIVVDKGGAFGMGAESGGDVGGLGKVTIYLEGSNIPYETNSNGEVTIPAYPTALKNPYALTINGHTYDGSEAVNITISGGGGVADSIDWAKVLNKPTTLAGYGITDALPLSGGVMGNNAGIGWSNNIHSWDDAVDGFECISVLSENLGYWSGFSYKGYYGLQIRAYGGDTDQIAVRGFNHANWGTWRNIIHSGNYANYALPLSGGVLSRNNNVLTINGIDNSYILFNLNMSARASVGYYNNLAYIASEIGGWARIGIADNGEPQYWPDYTGNTKHALIHSGNIGSQSVNYASRAGLADYSIYTRGFDYTQTQLDLNNLSRPMWWWYGQDNSGLANTPYAYGYGGGITFKQLNESSLNGQFAWDVIHNDSNATNSLWFRASNNLGWGNWKQVAFTDSNVASATKLQTGRYLWGNYFNGEQNISSALFLNSGGDGIYVDYNGINYHNSNNGWIATNINFQSNGGLWLSPYAGNVLIGVTDDYGYKLAVNGSSLANTVRTRELRLGETSLYDSITQNKWYYASIGYEYTDTSPNTLKPDIVFKTMYDTYAEGSGVERMRIKANGNVLIGTTNNREGKLQVAEIIRIHSNSSGYSGMHFDLDTSSSTYWHLSARGPESNQPFRFYHFDGYNYNTRMDITTAGDLIVTGGGAFGSDIRYKDITSYRQLDLETIADAPLFTFRWIDREDKVEHLGTSAQYWLDTQFKDAVNITNPKFFHLDYGALAVGIGISVAREVKVVKTEVQTLKEELSQVKKELKYYKELWQHSGHILHQHS